MRSFSLFLLAAAVLVSTSSSIAAPVEEVTEAGESGLGHAMFNEFPAPVLGKGPVPAPFQENDGLLNDPEEAGQNSDSDASDNEGSFLTAGPRRPRALRRRQFTPLVTADTMHQSVADSIMRPAGMGPFATTVIPGQPLSQNSFYAQEIFAMHNRGKGTCLSVKPDKKKPKLVTTRCNLNQAFAINSPVSFHWKPAADNNTAHLAIVYDGIEMCARIRWKGTYFYPCNEKSTRYSLGSINRHGSFFIRDAGRGNQCMDAEFHHALRMKPCGRGFRDQRWEKFHIAFMH